MTVSNTNLPPKTYICNGVTTDFPTTFPFFEEEDLVVTFIPDEGAEQTLVLNTDYTVSGGNGDVGTVTTIGTEGQYDDGILHIDRVMDLTQLLDLMTTGSLNPDDYEKGLDVLTLLVQQLQRGLNKSLHLSPTSLVANPIIPEAPNRMIGWNGNASGFTTYPPVITYTPLSDGRKYDIDPYESDQGANSSEGNKTIKDFLDIAGTTTLVRLRLKNLGPADTTTYPVLTGLTIPSNVHLEFEPGAILDNSGVNIYMANTPMAGPYQIFTDSVFFTYPQTVYAEWWGVDGTADEVEINKAVDSIKDNKGGIVQLLAKTYNTASASIVLYSGIRLLGTGYYDGAGVSSFGGTVIDSTYNGPIITVNGAHRFEISNMMINGNAGGSQDGIYLVQYSGEAPRSSQIFRVTVENVGRDGIRLDSFSYVTLDQVQCVTCGGQGFHFVEDTSNPLQEFLYMYDCTGQVCSSGFKIECKAHDLSIINCDFAQNSKGMEILGGAYGIYTFALSCVQNSTCDLEIHADTDFITRLFFAGPTQIDIKGTNTAQVGLYMHRSGGYGINEVFFENLNIIRNGATTPTNSISIGAGVSRISLGTVRDVSGGAHNFTGFTGSIKDYLKYLSMGEVVFTDSDSTPSVQGGRYFKTANTSATTITNFDDGYTGQRITIFFTDNYTTIDFTGTYLKGNHGRKWTAANTDWMDCVYTGTYWLCHCHHSIDELKDMTDASTSGTGEDNLKVEYFSAYTWGANGGIKIFATGTKTGTGGTKTIKLKVGYSSTITVHPAANNENDWRLEAIIVNTSLTAQRISWVCWDGDTVKQGYEATALDTSSEFPIYLTGECADAGDVITQTMWLIDKI